MPKFDATKIRQLVLLCCWQNKVEPNARGFEVIANQIQKSHDQNHPPIKQKYFQNLWSELNHSIDTNLPVHKGERHIEEILNYCGFLNWDDYVEVCNTVESFLVPLYDIPEHVGRQTALIAQDHLLARILPVVSYHSKLTGYKIVPRNYVSFSAGELDELLHEYDYVVTYLSPEEGNRLFSDRKTFEQVTASARFAPVWEREGYTRPKTGSLKNDEIISGESQLFLCLLILDELRERAIHISESEEKIIRRAAQIKVGKLNGVVSSGDVHITGKSIALRDSHTHIHKNSKS